MAEAESEQMTSSALMATDLSVSYGNLTALEAVDFRAEPGEFVSIVGPSGSGKTTLLTALAGFVPTVGVVNGPDRIGIVFQDYSVFPWMTVADNIAFGLGDLESEERTMRVKHYLRLIQMEDKATRYPGELSGGQAQRVAIARAFAPDPELILMDEPFGSLDRHTRSRMQQWLLEIWNEQHKTILFVTHDIEEALFLSDRVVVLKDRKVNGEFLVPFDRPRSDDLKFRPEFLNLERKVLDQMETSQTLTRPSK